MATSPMKGKSSETDRDIANWGSSMASNIYNRLSAGAIRLHSHQRLMGSQATTANYL
jgi:hypothetical protein